MSVYELEINPGPAEKGAERIVKSFDSIRAAMDKMEGSVSARAKKLVASFSELSRVRTVSREAISQLQALSASLGSFRGPSKTAVDNTTRFLGFLRTMGRLNIPSGSGMASFFAALSGFRGPTATAGRNTQSLLRALSGFSLPSGVGGRITGFLNALGGFRGPNAAAGKNTTALLSAISSFRGSPRNISAAIQSFNDLASAISKAASSMGTFRRSQGGNIRMPSAGRGGFDPRKYANDLGFLNTALLRTQTAFNSLGGILAARSIINASNAIIKIKAQLEAATGSVQQARVQFGFLQEMAQKYGLELVSLSQSYGFFLGAVKGTNVSMKEAREIFTGFSTAARALQLSTSDVDGVFRALGQMLSKGKLQAEELRGQLGDRLPGAFVRFAAALKMTNPGELDNALKKGAISGDILKKAILDVARTMQVEFAGSAEKMSKTVDAAFNRLKNAFTNAAAGLGSSGMNEALISLADTLRKFLESEALSAMLKTLAGAFKFLAENINLVVYALGTLAVSSVLKSIAAWSTLGSVLKVGSAIFGQLAVGVRALQMGMAATTVAAGLTSRAFVGLWAIISANPFLLIAVAIVGVVAALAQLRSKNEENLKAASAVTQNMADATNLYDAYINASYKKAGALDEETRALNDNTIAALTNARAKLGDVNLGMTTIPGPFKKTYYQNGNKVMDPDQYRRVVSSVSNAQGGYQAAITPNDFKKRVVIGGQLEQMKRLYPEQYKAYEQFHTALTTDINNSIALSHVGAGKVNRSGGVGALGFDAQGTANRAFGDYNKEKPAGGGITGTPVANAKKNTKGEAEARQFEQDIQRALEAVRDLKRETTSAYAEMDSYLKGQDTIAISARQQAQDKVNQLMDTFKTPEQAEKGLAEVNRRIAEQKQILDATSPAAQELVDTYAKMFEAQMHAQAARDASKYVNDLRKENILQASIAEATAQGGAAVADANRQMEIQKQLWDVNAEDAAKIAPELEKQLRLQEQITRQMDIANEVNAARLESNNMTDTAYLFRGGYNQDQVAYYKELIEYRNQLANDSKGYNNQEINDLVRIRAALLNQRGAYEEVQKVLEESRQMAQDMADAFVNGFQDMIDSGQSFGKTIKNIFGDLKKTILQFVLFDPLRKWLTDVLTVGTTKGAASASGGDVVRRGMGLQDVTSSLGSLAATASAAPGVNIMTGETYQRAPESTNVTAAQHAGAQSFDSVTSAVDNQTSIYVDGQKMQQQALEDIPQKLGGNQYFSRLKKVFDYKATKASLREAFSKGGSFGDKASAVMGAAGNAIAAYQMGNQIGKVLTKALGIKGRAGNVISSSMGGAAAGYTLGGPMGAAIGATIGAVIGFLKKVYKPPSSFGSVVVGENGVAGIGTTGTYGKADAAIGKQAAGGAASMFNQFALQYGGTLKPGNYGTFGQAEWKVPGPNNNNQYFYGINGVNSKGKPVGVEGVDWVRSTDQSEVQAFALIQQARRGMIAGLSDAIKTVFQNTKATNMDQLQSDLQVGQAYEEFIKGSFVLPDIASKVRDLNDAFEKMRKQAAGLGLSETKLAAARDRMMKSMRDDFNFTISQGILEITDPKMASYNALVRDYRDAVQNAMAVGGNLAEVERYYGLKRAEILKETSESAYDSIRTGAKELLTSLTASESSPLAPSSVFSNARGNFRQLQSELLAGNTTNVGNLSDYAQNYLSSASSLYGSSGSYFDVFREVTSFLEQMQNYTDPNATTGGTGGTIPELPSLQSLIDQINAQNAEMTGAINTAAATTTEIETNQLTELERIGDILESMQSGGGLSPIYPNSGSVNDLSLGYYGGGTFSKLSGSEW